jgi:hypothetical protein
MSLLQRHSQPSMLEGPYESELGLIDERLKKQKSLRVQFSGTKQYSEKLLSKLDTYCQKYGDKLNIRFYGHYSEFFDFNILKSIPHVSNLAIEISSNIKYKDVYALDELRHLKKLAFGFFHLKELDIYQSNVFTHLTELWLQETKSKAVDLSFLRRCKNLTLLSIHGYRKNVDAVGELNKLKKLALHSVPDFSLAFVNQLPKLETLALFLGGRKSINEIETNAIELLIVDRVRGFNQLENFSCFPKLKSLRIADCIQLETLHFDTLLPKLQILHVDNCKNLRSVTGLENLTQLQQMQIAQTEIDFDSLFDQQLSKTLKTVFFRMKMRKRDAEIERYLLDHGYKIEWTPPISWW